MLGCKAEKKQDSQNPGKRKRTEALDITRPSAEEDVSNPSRPGLILEESEKDSEPHTQLEATKQMDESQDNDQETVDLPCDTQLAISLLKSEFPGINLGIDVHPVALLTQVYGVVTNRTTVDKELDELRHQQVVRLFKLPIGPDDYAIMQTEDYKKEIEDRRVEFSTKGGDQSLVFAFDVYANRVLQGAPNVVISHKELTRLIGEHDLHDQRQCPASESIGTAADCKVDLNNSIKEEVISVLLTAGLLTRKVTGPNGYYFSSPSIGRIIKYLLKGREELLSLFRKCKFRDMAESDLLRGKYKIRHSILGMQFHIRDLLGKGLLLRLHYTKGTFLRLANASG